MRNIAILCIIVFATSCNRKCELPVQTIGTGEIISTALVQQPLITWEMRDNEHIIKTKSENIFDLKVSFDDGVTFDTIDFNKYTLLGKYAHESSRVSFVREVTKNETLKKYTYHITVYQCGTYKNHWESMNWVSIPKIEDDFDVEFQVKYITNKKSYLDK